MNQFTRPRQKCLVVSIALAVALVATSCSTDKDDTVAVSNETRTGRPVESGLPPASVKPVRGGQLVYGLEAESSGYCMPEAQLAISGMQVARAIYDPLVVPNGEGGYSPYLAKKVSHSDDYKTWTISLRSGIKFHNGEPFNAQAVKDNLDAYRAAPGNHERNSLLFRFALEDIATVTTTNDLTVEVTTKQPWVAFRSILYSGGRLLMVAPEQLMANPEDCAEIPIGTGPFKFVSWQHEVALKAERWPKYWQTASDGKAFPYVNAIEFRPMPNGDARIAALQQGDLNIMHTSTSADIASNITRLRDDGAINLLISEERTETSYFMLNVGDPNDEFGATFAKQDARVAVAQSIDRVKLNQLVNRGYPALADGPFAPDVLGYLPNPGFPKYDLAAAKKTVAKMKAEGRDTRIDLLSSVSLQSIRMANIARTMLEDAGFEVVLDVAGEADLIQRAIGQQYEMVVFRNQPGDDPDANRIWWRSDSLLNFGRFQDAVIDENLDRGRTQADPAVRKAAYEAVNRRMATQAYNIYLTFQPWAIAMASNVHNVLGPKLPDDLEPSGRLATGHSLLGLWIDPAGK